MDNLNATDYYSLWESGEGERDVMRKRMAYYRGEHDILGSDEYYSDGTKKSERVTNYIGYAIDMYVGSISGKSYNVTSIGDDDFRRENNGPENYREVGTANNFDTADVENTRNAFIYGWGLETFSYSKDSGIKITSHDPINWMRVYNSDNELIGLLNLSVIPAGGFYGDEQLSDNLEVMVVYTPSVIRTFHRTPELNNGDWFTPEGLADTNHNFGVVPAVVYKINESGESHISNDVIGQQDEYNEIDSASGDDIKNDSDGLLALKGFDAKDIQDNAENIKQWRLLGLPVDGDAKYIVKSTDASRINSRLERTRQHLFMSLAVPDVTSITGATGTTSGIALQLKFKPMLDKSSYIIANLRQGVRERINLINLIEGKIPNGKRIDDVQVNITFSLPRNTVEEWQNIGALTGIVSPRKQLELLTDVTDPDTEEARLIKSAETIAFDLNQQGSSEERALKVDAAAKTVEGDISTIIDGISDAVLAETQRRI